MTRTLLLVGLCACAPSAPVSGDVRVVLPFSARIGAAPFVCGQSYDSVGADAARIWPTDLRFYVHDVQLKNDQGEYVNVALDVVEPYQQATVAMLDFEDASANCETGTPSTRDRITGVVASGHYRGLRFRIGVPEALNHVNGDEVDDPLNNSGVGAGMLWIWLTGYKFFKLDFATSDKKEPDFSVHIGSMACALEADVAVCRNANRPLIELDDFLLETSTVVLDVAAIVSELPTNDPSQKPGCHSVNEAPACWATMPQFGLDFGFDSQGVPAAPGKTPQVVFSVEAQ